MAEDNSVYEYSRPSDVSEHQFVDGDSVTIDLMLYANKAESSGKTISLPLMRIPMYKYRNFKTVTIEARFTNPSAKRGEACGYVLVSRGLPGPSVPVAYDAATDAYDWSNPPRDYEFFFQTPLIGWGYNHDEVMTKTFPLLFNSNQYYNKPEDDYFGVTMRIDSPTKVDGSIILTVKIIFKK